MAKYAHPDLLDNGTAYLRANCNKMALISAYTFGATYATVNAAILAEVAMITTDFTLASSGNDRSVTSAAGKSDTAANASGGGGTNHLAFLDTVNSKVLFVTEETSGQAVAEGNPVNFPQISYFARQPVAV
jgi:hypothetical protein